ncbi:GDSL-type esterase/lipase family protein [Arthrobacter agilis]|uniref:GDSL-type esterase/lipase family protein n=1 Tax=Arthrobacter agilis TaxID=37921 RepID=UPI0027824AE9|nr:SGNH/GDSL hydrolase family protein [Arthrobacter agilis]MDQ0735344.1 hypothetical protein [Arthrobacter agilis]
MAEFDQIFANDPNNPQNVAENGVISIYAPGTRTLLALKTVTGGPLSNPLQLNSRGFGPAFIADGYTLVAWEAVAPGEVFQGTFKSYTGVLQEAVAAKTAAQGALGQLEVAVPERVSAEVAEVVASGVLKGEPGKDGANVATTRAAVAGELQDPTSPSRAVLSATIANATVGSKGRRAPLAKFKQRAANSRTQAVAIVFDGSSTTAGGNATTPARRYVNRLTAIIQGEYPSGAGAESTPVILDDSFTAPINTPGIHAYNAGIPGARTDVYVSPIRATQIGLIKPALVIHMPTSNDWTAGYDPATSKANILDAIARMDAAGASDAVHLLINQFQRFDYFGPRLWQDYGAIMKEIADSNPERFWYIDLNPTYLALDVPGADPLDVIDIDRTHQNDKGHELMADLLRAEFEIPAQISVGTALVSTVDVLTRTAPVAGVRDSFDRADAANLGTADSGQPWGAGGFAIVAGKAVPVTGGNTFLTWAQKDFDLRVNLTWAAGTAPGVLFRSFDGGNRMGAFVDSGGVFLAITKSAASTNVLGLRFAPVAGTTYALRVVARGNQLNAYLDGRLALAHTLTVDDLAYFTAGTQYGFRCAAASSAVAFDALTARVI